MTNDSHRELARPMAAPIGEVEINILDFAADARGRGGVRVLGRRLPAMVAQLLRAAGVSARHSSATVPLGEGAGEASGWAVPAGMLDDGEAIALSRRMGRARLLAFGELGPPKKAGMTLKLRVLRREDGAEVLRFEKDFFEEEAADVALRLAHELSRVLPHGEAPLAAIDVATVLGAADPEALLRLQEGLDGLVAVEGELAGADLDLAIGHLLGALEREPSSAAFDHAFTAIVTGSREAALLGVERAVERAAQLAALSKRVEAILLQARLLRTRGELGAAKAALEAALDEKKQDLMLVAELTQVLGDLGLTEEALSLCRHALESPEAALAPMAMRANLQEELGLALAREGQLEAARASLKSTVALDEHRPRAWANLGRCHHLLSAHDDARAAYERSLELNPHAWEVLRNLVALLTELGELPAAEAALAGWSKRRPDDPLPQIAMAELMLAQNRADEAVRLLEAAAERSPDDVRLQAMLGGVFTQTQDFDRAEASYREALRCSPKDPALMSNLAVVLSHLGDITQAEELARQAVELNPGDLVSRRVLDHIRGKN
jgi:tetratricopeptide (TPR) repeat protein